MKKTYIAPQTNEVSVMAESMMNLTSIQTHSDKQVNTKTGGVQLGNQQQGQWGDLWNK